MTHDEVLAMVDQLLSEPVPPGGDDICAELSAMVVEHKNDRRTERPGCEEGGCR